MTNPLISLLLPTRARPALVERFFDSVINTTSNLSQIEIILYVDDDDLGSHQLDSSNISIARIIGPSLTMGHYNTACLKKAKGSIILLVNDDVIIRTSGWDEKIVRVDAEFHDKIYLAYANDLFKKAWCSFPILSRKTCELLVEPYPTIYRGAFIDTHLYDIFQRLKQAGHDRTRYLNDVVFEHLHYRAGKAVYDETYKKRGRFADDEHFVALVAQRSASACRLLNTIRGEPSSTPPSPQKTTYTSTRMIPIIGYLTRQFLFDRELPLRWRHYLWYWFIGRYLAARGWLWPFVK